MTREVSIHRKREMKIRVEINKIENEQTIEKIYENKSWFVTSSSKINELLGRVTKDKREKM